MDRVVIVNLVGVALLFLALVLHIVCMATPNYCSADFPVTHNGKQVGVGEIYFGMWKTCLKTFEGHTCLRWSAYSDSVGDGGVKTLKATEWMAGVQAMALLGMIFLVFAGCCAVINVAVKSLGDRRRLLYIVIALLSWVAALSILIGDIIMGAKRHKAFDSSSIKEEDDPHHTFDHLIDSIGLSWGFGLDIFSCVIALAGGVVHVIGGRWANE